MTAWVTKFCFIVTGIKNGQRTKIVATQKIIVKLALDISPPIQKIKSISCLGEPGIMMITTIKLMTMTSKDKARGFINAIIRKRSQKGGQFLY